MSTQTRGVVGPVHQVHTTGASMAMPDRPGPRETFGADDRAPMTADPTTTDSDEDNPNEVGWRELAETCRKSVQLCMEGSRRSFVIVVIASILKPFRPAALAATAGLIVSEVEAMM